MKPCDMESLLGKDQKAKSKKTKQEEKIAEDRALEYSVA